MAKTIGRRPDLIHHCSIELSKVIAMQIWRFAALAALSLFPFRAVAQDQCADTAQILAFADTILADRALANRFEQRRIGAEAAYLKIVYGHPDDATIVAMLADLTAEPMPDGLQLLATYTIAQSGIEDGLRILDPDPVRAFTIAGRSVRRAIMLADDGQTYFDLLRRAVEVPDFETVLPPQMISGIDIISIVPGQSDERLAAMAQNAEAAGFVPASILLSADMTTLDAFYEVVARHPDEPFLADPTTISWINYSGATLRHDTGPIPRPDPAAQAERGASDQAFYTALRASYMDGPAHFSGIIMNQTGRMAEGEIVALAFLTEVTEGRLNPARDPEAAWLFQYRAWVALMGREAVNSVLGYFDFPTSRVRHFAGTALDTLDWMVAKESLRPFLMGETQTVPTRPALLSDGFDWDAWITVAGMLDTDSFGLLEADPSYQRIAIELLADTGRYDMMNSLAEITLEPFERLNLLRDIMQRLDRRCEGWTVTSGEAMFLAGDTLFRF